MARGFLTSLTDLAWFSVRTRILGHKIPLIASFKLTYRCNLSCRACPFHTRSSEIHSHIDWETAMRSLRELKKRGCLIVIFEGGEPFLWSDGDHTFRDLVTSARELFPCVGATTNGTLGFDVPADILWVSVDGLEDTHNFLRSNSYQRVLHEISSCRHPNLLVHYTLNRLNWREFGECATTMLSLTAVKGITVQIFYPYGQGEDDLTLSTDDRRQALMSVMNLKRSGYPIMNSAWSLNAMMTGHWTCHDWLLANVNPDGSIDQGCYVRGRGNMDCSLCGFTPVAEASGAFSLVPGSLKTGWSLFFSRSRSRIKYKTL
ncbi:MAG: radical SAM protein [Desulfomonilia bacterium]